MPPSPLAHVVSHPSSSSATNTTAQQQRPRLLTPTTNPIPLLNAPTAQLYSLIHTALLPSLYLLRSSALIADPLRTLTYDILPVATSQAAFCVLCIPSYGSWSSEFSASSPSTSKSTFQNTTTSISSGKASIGRRKGRAVNTTSGRVQDPTLQNFAGRVLPAVFSLLLTLLLPPVPLQILLHALGAPLLPLSILPHTLALATHLSLLIFYPLFYAHGVSAGAWRDIIAAWAPFDPAGVWGGSIGAVMGAWLGAIPIALDWDRKWQEWPITVVWGAVMGWVVGRVLTAKGMGALGWGARVDLSEHELDVRDVLGADAVSSGEKKEQ